MSLTTAVRFRYLITQLTNEERTQFIHGLLDTHEDIIMTSLFQHLSKPNQIDEVNNLNESLADIIQSRKDKPNSLSTQNRKLHQLPRSIIGHTASFLNQCEYTHFSIANRCIYLGCTLPSIHLQINLTLFPSIRTTVTDAIDDNQSTQGPTSEFCIGTLGRIIVPDDSDAQMYVSCAKVPNNFGLYGWHHVNIDESLKSDEIVLESNEMIYVEVSNVEVIGNRKEMFIIYLKYVCNERLDEIIDTGKESLKILMKRLRGKIRNGGHGQIKSVNGVIATGIWDTLCDDIDLDPSKESVLISRHKLSTLINNTLCMRVFDTNGKELKWEKRNIMECDLYSNSECSRYGFTRGLKKCLSSIRKKYPKATKKIKVYAMNGLRIKYNQNTRRIKLITNTHLITMKDMNGKETSMGTIGRKTGW
eukprot:102444_1